MNDMRDPDISLAVFAMEQEGKTPVVISMSMWLDLTDDERRGKDYLVLQDETYAAWLGLW